MAICCAFIKHGYPNFSLYILEYCSVADLIIREKHYFGIFKLEYNIAQDPSAPMSGRTHSDATKIIMSEAKKGENLSDETKTKISDAHKEIDHSGRFKTGDNHPGYGQTRSENTKKKISDALKDRPRPEGAGKPSQQIEVSDIQNNQTTTYDSISEAARALNIPSHKSISIYFTNNQQKPYKGRYTFKKI